MAALSRGWVALGLSILLGGCGAVTATPADEAGAPAHRDLAESSAVVAAVRDGALPMLESGAHYAIHDGGVKRYGPATLLVQSSGAPINLGADMLPLMDTARLHEFVKANDIPVVHDAPAEIYLYNWVDGAQGAMVFDVGVAVADDIGPVDPASGLEIKRYPAMKFASLIYLGAFPHEEASGWRNLRWEERTRAQGLVYTERLYGELYHLYDYANTPRRHIVEIQIEVE